MNPAALSLPSLVMLPPCVMNKIYREVLTLQDPIELTHNTKTNTVVLKTPQKSNPAYTNQLNLTGLLRTHRRFRNDASALFYWANTFEIPAYKGSNAIGRCFARFQQQIGPISAAAIRNIKIRLDARDLKGLRNGYHPLHIRVQIPNFPNNFFRWIVNIVQIQDGNVNLHAALDVKHDWCSPNQDQAVVGVREFHLNLPRATLHAECMARRRELSMHFLGMDGWHRNQFMILVRLLNTRMTAVGNI